MEGDVNARDVERLCEVVSSREDASVSQIAAEVFGPRCADDEQRRKLEKAVGAAVAPACPVDLAPDCLRAGGVALARAFAIAPAAGDDDDGGAPRRIAATCIAGGVGLRGGRGLAPEGRQARRGGE